MTTRDSLAWLTVGGVVVGTTAFGAWLASRSDSREFVLKTLDQFIAEHIGDVPGQASENVREPGFRSFYARAGSQFVRDRYVPNTVTIANVTASRLGRGVFTKLSERLHAAGHNVYVECVQNPRFEEKLRQLGYEEIRPARGCPSFFLPA
jgi:hypothetical protein